MKYILFISLAVSINFHLFGQIKEWQMTNSFEDQALIGIESSNKRYIAKVRGNSISVFDTKNGNREITVGLTDGQYGDFSEDNRHYILFYGEKVSIRFLENDTGFNELAYINAQNKILSIIVRKNLVYCSLKNGKVSVYDWQKRIFINSFQVGEKNITFIKQNLKKNAVVFKEDKKGLFHWNLETYKVTKVNSYGNNGWLSEDGLFVFYEEIKSFYKFDVVKGTTEKMFTIPMESWLGDKFLDELTFRFTVNPQNTLLVTYNSFLNYDESHQPCYLFWDLRNGNFLKKVNLNNQISSVSFKENGQEIVALTYKPQPPNSKEKVQNFIHLNDISKSFQSILSQNSYQATPKKDEINAQKGEYLSKSRRFALVVGNSRYKFNDLNGSPVYDAIDITTRLDELDFNVSYVHDASKKAFDDALLKLSKTATSSDVILFFYAGHGIEVDGKNYLIPIDATLEKKSDVPKETIALDNILDMLKKLNSPVNLVYLDACRNNPFKSWSRGDNTLGFTEVEINAPTMKVFYATQPGAVAANGTTRNGPFTSSLLKFLIKGVDSETLMRNVTKEVYIQTKQVQVPWQKGSLINEFKF
jgi:hypothetical protein